MKKSLSHTRVSVKLRKAEFRKEWYLYIESYPVICKNGGKPQRVREYVNRTITTPIWDKSRTARTASDGSVTYKPKRDVNGVILCKSELDQESCIYADKVRTIRQKEYDTAGLYSESEASLLEQKEKSQCDFITYFKSIIDIRHRNSSDSIIVNWNRVYALMLIFTDNQPMIFANIDTKLVEDFRLFLLDAPQGGNKKGTISQNTASTYFAIFKAGLKQAFVDGYFVSDIAAKIKGIKEKEARRGAGVVNQLCLDFKATFPDVRGFSVRNLYYMKEWYEFYMTDDEHKQILHQLGAKLQETENHNPIKLHQLGAEIISNDKISNILENNGMLPSMRNGDLNVAMIFTRRAHVTSRSKSITANSIVRTNLLKRNLKPSVVP